MLLKMAMRIGFPLLLALAGCVSPSSPAATSTSVLSAPPLMPSPTPVILSSEQLYRDDRRFIGQSSPDFAQFPVDAALPPAPRGDVDGRAGIVLEDGAVLFGQMFQFSDLRQPGILMIGPESTDWGMLPSKLAQAGFAVLVMENAPQAGQIETIVQSLAAAATVDPGRIGLIGAAQGADAALLGCAVNALCDAAALLGPLSRDTLLNMMPSYGQRPLWLAASRQDAESHAAALALSQTALAEVEFVEVEAGRGAALLQFQPQLTDQLIDWFEARLSQKDRPAP